MKNTGVTSFNLVFVSVVLFFYILYIWASFIIPFVIALLISLAIISLSAFFKNKWVNKALSFIMSLMIFTLFFFFIGIIINSNVQDMITQSWTYQEKLKIILKPFFDQISTFPFNVEELKNKVFETINISKALWFIFSALTSIVSYMWIIFFYVIFLLLESRFISGKIKLILWKMNWKEKIIDVIDHIKRDVRSYFVIKTVISIITAFLSYIVLLSFRVDFALFWALLVFILNFIPTIGSIIALIFPLLFAFIQFSLTIPFIAVTSLLIWIQVLMWNFIEPRFMWNKLNLSPLVIILSLWFWWLIWWVVGMLLSVPIMVIINIILWNIKATKPLAILMSEKWEIKSEYSSVKNHKNRVFRKLKNKLFKK